MDWSWTEPLLPIQRRLACLVNYEARWSQQQDCEHSAAKLLQWLRRSNRFVSLRSNRLDVEVCFSLKKAKLRLLWRKSKLRTCHSLSRVDVRLRQILLVERHLVHTSPTYYWFEAKRPNQVPLLGYHDSQKRWRFNKRRRFPVHNGDLGKRHSNKRGFKVNNDSRQCEVWTTSFEPIFPALADDLLCLVRK